MAKNGPRIKILMRSSLSAYAYATTKNRRNTPQKLKLRKYDPVVRKHVLFKETKA